MTDPKAQADAIDPRNAHLEIRESTLNQARAVMRRDDACDILQPSDIRILVGTIDDLRARIEELESAAALAGKMAIEQCRAVIRYRASVGAPTSETFEALDAKLDSLSKPIDRNALVERGARALESYCRNPTMLKCQRCNGVGYHHGFGENGHDPDWCLECGGNQYIEDPNGPVRAVLSAWIGEETK